MFITFEGIDGCGKSTQIKLLSEHLNNKGIDNIIIREPGGTDFSEDLREILLNFRHDINMVSEMFLFESARADLTINVIAPALEEGKYVLSDRFFDSTTAYQGYGRGLDIDKLEMLHQLATFGISPDITFYLDITLKQSKKRFNKKKLDRMEKAGDVFFERVIEGYREITRENKKRIKTIDATGSIEETHKKIVKLLEEAE